MADGTLLKDRFAQYKCCANDAIEFKLVREESDIESDVSVFRPEMSHQLFGDNESIFGYKDLKIKMYYTAASLQTYLGMTSSEQISPEKFDGVYADDVMKPIVEKIPPGFFTNMDEFIKQIPKEASFQPFGEMIHSYKIITKENQEKHFAIFKTSIESPSFREYHERLRTFLLWFVDAASYLDDDDDRWSYYLLFEKYKSNGNPMFALAGYMTVYRYYAYPERIRPRISQVLVFPPFQRQGHGSRLIQTFYDEAIRDKEVLDITVEDPSEDFQRVRDYVDASNCRHLKSFQPENLKTGFCKDMFTEAREKLKINKKQARRIYEILRLKATNVNDLEDFKKYRLDIKRRINAPFAKTGREMSKLEHSLNTTELTAAMNSLNTEQRMTYLQKEFEDLVEQYEKVVKRIAIL
ncbi:histone acetyltransferase type B catalytic subunit-like [Lineus longissimus]|uniref:histone acetyltransferase type B catalytic subunit-like n=1 Tax=Lineus longissimus TaxID=88925 RepID=UPI002B4D4AB2